MTQPTLTPGKGLWLTALLLAALLHIGVAALALWSPAQAQQGQAKAAGTGGIEISLGPAGRSAGGPEQQQAEPPVQTEPEPPRPEPAPQPKPKPEPKPEPKKPTVAEQAIQPVVEPLPPSQPAAVEPTTSLAKASEAGAAGQSGNTEQNDSGSGDNSSGGGLPGDTDDYAATLLAWLEQHKQYPRAARSRRQQGTVLLYFVMDRQGRVSVSRIEKSSGYPLLDNEALKMLERAQPLPAMPESMNEQQLELVVPVQFFLR